METLGIKLPAYFRRVPAGQGGKWKRARHVLGLNLPSVPVKESLVSLKPPDRRYVLADL